MQSTGRQSNLLIGLVLVALAEVLLLRAFGQIPDGLYDLVMRGLPVLLVLIGLTIFLRPRMPLGGLVAFIVSAALVGGVAAYSFNIRASQQRDENRQPIAQTIAPDVTLLRVRVQTGTSNVEILPALTPGNIMGEFVGSSANGVNVTYVEEQDTTATVTLNETVSGGFPSLDAVGRGALRVELPANVPLDVELLGLDGDVILSMNGLQLERLNLNLQRGDAVVTLSEYAPQLSGDEDTLGTLAARNGDITVFVPASVAARLDLEREGSQINPEYNAALYDYLRPDTLQSVNVRLSTNVQRYVIAAPRGVISIRDSEA